jgi:hypothetical protein
MDEPLTVGLEQNGGRIACVVEGDASRPPFLFHGSAFLPLETLRRTGVAVADGAAVVVENLTPGRYELCLTTPAEAILLSRSSTRPAGTCTSGFLAPGGVLTLLSPSTE